MISEEDWENSKDLFKKYYIDEKKTLKDTTARMKEHGIDATSRQWERRAEKWGFFKYAPRSESGNRPNPSYWDLVKEVNPLVGDLPEGDRMRQFLLDSDHYWTALRTSSGPSNVGADEWSATHCQDASGASVPRLFKRGWLSQGHVYTVCSPSDPSTHMRTFVVLASRERTWTSLRIVRGIGHMSLGLLQHHKRLVSTKRLDYGALAAEDIRFMIELSDGQVLYNDTWIDLEESWNLAHSMNVMCCGRLAPKSFQQAVQQHTQSYLSAFSYLLPQPTQESRESDRPAD